MNSLFLFTQNENLWVFNLNSFRSKHVNMEHQLTASQQQRASDAEYHHQQINTFQQQITDLRSEREEILLRYYLAFEYCYALHLKLS